MSDLVKWNVTGPVRTLRTEFAEWDLSLEQWQAARQSTFARFHPDGRIDEVEHHNPDGSICRTNNVYDSAGRLQESRFEMNGVPSGKMVHFYDEGGRLTRIVSMDRDGSERELEASSYDQDGKRTKVYSVPKLEPNTGFSYGVEGTEYQYGATGATIITTRYDDRGQPGEVLFSDKDHRLLKRVNFTRDSSGRLLREEMQLVEEIPFPDLEKRLQNVSPEEREAAVAAFANLFGPQKIMSSVTYSYDAKWRVLERRMRMGDLSDDRTTSRYDDHDNPIEKTIVDTHREMHADEEGKLQTTKEDSNAQTVRFEYVYDPQGNWTEQVVSGRWEPNPNFQRSNVSRRDITYYPAT